MLTEHLDQDAVYKACSQVAQIVLAAWGLNMLYARVCIEQVEQLAGNGHG
jgi:hypothetical protein